MPDAPSSRRVKRRRGARVIVLARGVSTRAGDSVAGPGSTSVLLQGDTDPGLPGSRFWQTPGGGIDDGELPRQAAARELYEETGLAVAPEDLSDPVATRTVTHGYSDRILIQHETFFRITVPRFEPVHAALTEAEARRRVETSWHPLDALPADVWPSNLALLAAHNGDPLDLGDVEESTVPAPARTLYLVRHGQSTWNLERRLQGQRIDVPLTDLGRAQAASAADDLAESGAKLVISSDQVRALETARAIADRLGAPVHTTEALREQHLGDLEGTHYDDLTEEPVPDDLDISEVRWGGGESVQDVHRRLTAFVAGLPSTGDLVIVSHGDTLRILLAVLAGRGHRDVEWLEFGNGEVRAVSWHERATLPT